MEHDREWQWHQAQADRLTDPAECTPDEVAFSVRSTNVLPGTLSGTLTARNISTRPWRITGKPVIVRVTADGAQLPENHIVTLEGRFRNWIVVEPGEHVVASVSMSSWDGAETADHFVVSWPGGVRPAVIDGPVHPSAPDSAAPMSTSSSWFRPPPPEELLTGALMSSPDRRSAKKLTLLDFLRARLTDERTVIERAHRLRCGTGPTPFRLTAAGVREETPCHCDQHVTRLLAATEAKLAVIDTVDPDVEPGVTVLRLLAQPFADHPDFPVAAPADEPLQP